MPDISTTSTAPSTTSLTEYQPRTTINFQKKHPQYVRNDYSSGNGTVDSHNLGPIDVDRPFNGLLTQYTSEGVPFRYVHNLRLRYDKNGYEPDKDPMAWGKYLNDRSKWLYQNNFSQDDLDQVQHFMSDRDFRTDLYKGAIGGAPFAIGGFLTAVALNAPWAAHMAATKAWSIGGPLVAALENLCSSILSTRVADWNWGTVPRPQEMLDPAVAAQYPNVLPVLAEILKAAAEGFFWGYTGANLLKAIFNTLTAYFGMDNPFINATFDAIAGMTEGGGVTGVFMGEKMRKHGLTTTLAREDYQDQIAYAWNLMNQSSGETLSSDFDQILPRTLDVGKQAVSSFLPPEWAGGILGHEYGPPSNPTWFGKYIPEIARNFFSFKLLGSAAMLTPYVFLTNYVSDLVAKHLPEGTTAAKEALVRQLMKTLMAMPFFYFGSILLVLPEALQAKYCNLFQHSPPKTDEEVLVQPAPASGAAGDAAQGGAGTRPDISFSPFGFSGTEDNPPATDTGQPASIWHTGLTDIAGETWFDAPTEQPPEWQTPSTFGSPAMYSDAGFSLPSIGSTDTDLNPLLLNAVALNKQMYSTGNEQPPPPHQIIEMQEVAARVA